MPLLARETALTTHRLLLATAALLLITSCQRRERLNVLVVTLDTTRADALGVYGARTGASPSVDAVAATGVIFDSATAVAPLTIPSHTSLFTGTFPPFHGVRENGRNRVPEKLVTLAELFKAKGYRTGASVGAYVLDARWGLNQGFDMYAGAFDSTNPDVSSLADLQRPANEVIDDALRWLRAETGREKPFFLWVHLFDPHTPYAPPSPFRERYATNPYAGEIAFADSELSRLLRQVDPANTALVIAGDHGEGFGEHRELGHGLLLYEETLHVPLIVAAPGLPRGARVSTPVSLVDVFPTLAELAGVAAPAEVRGHSLAPLWRGAKTHATPIYAETIYPRNRFGWSDLRALRDGSRKIIESSRPEMYDLRDDPGERRDLAGEQPAALRDRRGQLARVAASLETNAIRETAVPIDAEARARLAALGYITGASEVASKATLPSPVDKIGSFQELSDARVLLTRGELDAAERRLLDIARAEPSMVEAHVALGELYLRAKQFDRSSAAFRNAYALAPDDPAVVAALATADIHAGNAVAASELLRATIEITPSEPRFRYLAGRAALARGDIAAAESFFNATLELNPRSAAALVDLAGVAVARKQPERAQQLASRALAIDNKARGARLYMAQALDLLGRREEAWQQASEEMRLSQDFRAVYFLAELAPRAGRDGEAETLLRETIRREPRFIAAYLALARLLLQRNERFDEGIRLTKTALDLKPRGRDEALAYFLLADFYSRTGRIELSKRNAGLARAALDRRADASE